MKPSLLIPAITHLVNIKRPVMLWGPPGVGKSDIVQQIAATLNKNIKKPADKFSVVDLRLANCDPTDIKGFPMPDATKKVMNFLPMASLPTKGNGILFLDELTNAPMSVQAAAYQLVLNREVGDYKLPEGWAIVAAGNRTTDRSAAHAMSAALSSRFIHLDFTVDHEDWVDWAIANGISDITRGYIRMQPGDLVVDKIEPGARAFHTPRTWAFADKIITSELPPDVMKPMLEGTIGEGMAVKFLGYALNRKQMPNLDKIILDPDSVPAPESPSVKYAVLAGLEARVSASNFERVLRYVKKLGRDFEVVFATAADRRDPEICETKAFTDWLRENRDVLVG